MSHRRSPAEVTLSHHIAAYVFETSTSLEGLEPMRSLTLVPAGRAGAIYDLIVTAAFATPWTAALVLSVLAQIHNTLRLPGVPMPTFETPHLLFVTLFGIVVTMWGVVRVIWPVPLLITADTAGRAAFALAFVWALAAGHSAVIVGFLILEVIFLIAQAVGVRKALKADRVSSVALSRSSGEPDIPSNAPRNSADITS
jgi:hypothetical protein